MKVNDILNESTDLIARYHRVGYESEDQFNLEAQRFAAENEEYYKQFFKEFYENGEVPVFDVVVNDVNIDNDLKFNTTPSDGEQQSAGYRGKQYAKRAAGHKYNKQVQGRQ